MVRASESRAAPQGCPGQSRMLNAAQGPPPKFPEASPNSKPHSESSLSQPLLDSPKSPLTDSPHPPILWRSKFTEDVASQLVSWSNPDGIINNSELELAGVIGHNDILANCTNIQDIYMSFKSIGNSPSGTHSWATKGAVSSTGPSSYLLPVLRLKSMHQRAHRYQLRTFYIPCPINKMAYDCSRLWHLTDKELLEHFNRTYPQAVPWQI
ncbi:hypothetical protein THAOC_29155 [Thalassiosira oceanica]|uniref:Uncharacterized protein n=1 Tax=Thalassiosira oceanica TaxID=159749 RepID=K0RHA8_THAOC|nr:hypothetical protein THAOC_29155 [Thalassiosira oceanica]|eukprot:EJK51654.1 hypothetical protein THAOC_29155 [Thalassiosira oceanica]